MCRTRRQSDTLSTCRSPKAIKAKYTLTTLFCRVTEDGQIFILEVNAFCSFGPLSLIPKIANNVGISNYTLYAALLENARERRSTNKIMDYNWNNISETVAG